MIHITINVNGDTASVELSEDEVVREDFDRSDFSHRPDSIQAVVEDREIHPVVDSGEPELERGDHFTDADLGIVGVWTMTNDELQSRLDEAYARGLKDGRADLRTQTTRRALEIIAVETNHRVLSEWETETNEDEANADGDLFAVGPTITKGEYAKRFAILLATRLGYEVSE